LLTLSRKISQYFSTKIRNSLSELCRNAIGPLIISEPERVFSCSSSFSFSNNKFNYYGNTPYWFEFQNIQPRKIGFSEFNNSIVIGKGIVLNHQGNVILESTIFQKEYLNKLNNNHLILFKSFLRSKSIEKAIVLSNYLDKNYYHWVMESLGRLAMVDEKELKDYTIVVDVNAPKFVTESLIFLFELDKSKIFYNSNKKIEVSSLLVPSFPITRDDSTNWTNIYFPEVIQKLNEISLNRTYKEAAKTNFIISRKNATQRRIINSETFFERYSDLNFKIFFLEEMNFKEQMQLFRNANIVISTHGAGLVNLLFSEEAEVIEFFPSNRTKRDAFYFYQITQVLKIKHSIIEYDSVSSEQDLILNQKHFNLLDEILNRN
jgi:hypothetical protein